MSHKPDNSFLLALILIFFGIVPLAWRLARLQSRVDTLEKSIAVDAGTP